MASGGDTSEPRRPGPVVALLAVAFLTALVVVRVTSSGQPQEPVGATETEGVSPSAPAERSVVRAAEPEERRLSAEELGGLRFEDVTARVGLQRGGPAAEPEAAQVDAGVATADIDDDGDLDVLLTSSGPASGLYRNDDGRFVDISRDAGIERLAAVTVAVFADLDADADLDLFLGGPGSRFGQLLVNDGTGRFVDQARQRGVVGRPQDQAGSRSVRGADVGDVDGDGDLDLVVTDWNPAAIVAAEAARGDATAQTTGQCHFSSRNRRALAAGTVEPTGDSRLFLNDGGGRFADATERWGLGDLGIALAFTPQLVDLDADGWLDLAVTGDTCTSALFRNRRGSGFVDVTRQAGVGRDENGMGSLVRDLDGDGRPDWLVTSISYPTAEGTCPRVSLFAGCSGNRVYLNEGDLTFSDATDDLGLRDGGWAWGVVGEDFANDGRLQIAATNGRVGAASVDPGDQAGVYYDRFRRDPTRFWVRSSEGQYVDVARQVGIEHDAVAHGLVAFDYDRDGRMDLLVANASAPPTLFRNVTEPRRHWLGVRLHDPSTPGNASGLGARIEVTPAVGRPTTRQMITSGSYETQHPAEVHVGLGASPGRVVSVRVWWPGGTRPQVLTDLRPDHLMTITRAPGH